MCQPTNEPEFKIDDKAEFRTSNRGWTPVYITSGPLRWAGRYHGGDNYLVQCVEAAARTGPPFLVYGSHLRRVQHWEPCPGKHRWANTTPVSKEWENMERLVE